MDQIGSSSTDKTRKNRRDINRDQFNRKRRASEVERRVREQLNKREKKGMTKDLINASLEKLYRFFVEQLDQGNIEKQQTESLQISMGIARSFVKSLVEWQRMKGEADNYLFTQAHPRTQSSEYTGATLYESYINPQTGSMIVNYVYRKTDQDWRKGQEYIPEEWKLKDIHASDLEGEQYARAAKIYEELTGNKASALTEIYIDRIEDDETIDVLSRYIKPGEKKTFSKKLSDEGFPTIIDTPIGRVICFMLAQDPEKVGVGEVTEVEVEMSHLGAMNMKLYIN